MIKLVSSMAVAAIIALASPAAYAQGKDRKDAPRAHAYDPAKAQQNDLALATRYRDSMAVCLREANVPLNGTSADPRPGCIIVSGDGVSSPLLRPRCLPAYRPAGDACDRDVNARMSTTTAAAGEKVVPWDAKHKQ